MGKTTILAIGSKEETAQTITELTHCHAEWEVVAASTDEEAVEKFHRYPVDIILFNTGIRDEEERKLSRIFVHQHPDVIILQHGSGTLVLLEHKIQEALDKHRKESKPTVSFVDDALGKAGLNIIVQ